MNYTFRTIIEKDGKQFHGYVPALLGCHTSGKTIEDTQNNLADAITLYVQSLVQDDIEIPQDKSFESFQTIVMPKKYA